MPSHTQIPAELRERTERALESGEKILWIQMPVARAFDPRSKRLFLFGLLWLAFAFFWMINGSLETWRLGRIELFQFFFPMMGAPFVLVGLWLLSSPFLALRKALRTVYVITDRRAITLVAGATLAVRSYSPSNLSRLTRKQDKDGVGDVIFSRRSWVDSIGHCHCEHMGFLQVREPGKVEEMLRKLAESASALDAEPDGSQPS